MATEKLFLATSTLSKDPLNGQTPEQRSIRDIALSDAKEKHYIDIIEQGGLSYRSLWDYVHSDEWQTITMLHYIGHSSNQGISVEPATNQQPSVIDLDTLSELFTKPNNLRFAFFNSCWSQEIANILSQAGVPYVIGTTKTVKDDHAVQIAKKFYEILGNVSVKIPYTIEGAFNETQNFFTIDDTDPVLQQAFKQSEVHRGGLRTSDSEPANPMSLWKLYSRPDLTDEQRNWRLIPSAIDKPTVINERFIITDSPASTDPIMRFFVSCITTDQPLYKELIRQIRQVFSGFTIKSVWNDAALTRTAERDKQRIESLAQSEFIFIFISTIFLDTPVGRQVIEQAREQWQQHRSMVPILFITDNCDWRSSAAGQFNPFPISEEIVEPEDLKRFADDLYEQWLVMQRRKR